MSKGPSNFPELHHTKHKPTGEDDKAHYIKGSHKTERGHESYDNRMPHPFGQDAPQDESGEGLNE